MNTANPPNLSAPPAIAQAINEGRWADAERELAKALVSAPDNPAFLFLMAHVLYRTARPQNAESYATKAVEQNPTAQSLSLLARIYSANNKSAAAASAMKQYFAVAEGTPSDWEFLAQMAEAARDFETAARAYREVLVRDPDALRAAYKFFHFQREKNPQDTIATIKSAIDRGPKKTASLVHLYQLYFPLLKIEQRHAAGAAVSHAFDVEDLPLRFVTKDIEAWHAHAESWYRAAPERPDSSAMYFLALMLSGRMWQAEPVLNTVRATSPDKVMMSYTLAEDFYRGLDQKTQSDILAGLPRTRLVAAPHHKPSRSLFVGCDPVYFERFVRPLIGSCADKLSGAGLHVHVFDGNEDELKREHARLSSLYDIPLTVSTEITGIDIAQRPVYAHAMRFVRLFEFSPQYPGGCWQIDADMLLNRDPAPMFDALANHELGLWLQPGRLEPNNHIQASAVGVTTTPAGVRFTKLVAAYLAEIWHQGRLRWGADQAALYFVLMYLKKTAATPRIAPLTADVFDNTLRPDRIFWPGKLDAGHPDQAILDQARERALAVYNNRVTSNPSRPLGP